MLLEVLLKCGFWPSRSRVQSENLHFQRAPRFGPFRWVTDCTWSGEVEMYLHLGFSVFYMQMYRNHDLKYKIIATTRKTGMS